MKMKELQRNGLSRIVDRLHRIPRLLRSLRGANKEAADLTRKGLSQEVLLHVPKSVRTHARITAAQRAAQAVQNKHVQRLDW